MSRPQHISKTAATLWASALLIAALTIVKAGRQPSHTAHGEMTMSRADYTIMTTNSGRGGDADPDELLYVIDNRDQVLMVYEIEDARRGHIILRDGGSLDILFRRARP